MPLHAVADRTVNQRVLDDRAPSVGALFRDRVARTPDSPAYLSFKDGGTELVTLTWRETDAVVRAWAAGLIGLDRDLRDDEITVQHLLDAARRELSKIGMLTVQRSLDELTPGLAASDRRLVTS